MPTGRKVKIQFSCISPSFDSVLLNCNYLNMNVPEFYQGYVDNCEHDSVVQGLIIEGNASLDFYRSIGPALFDYAYSDGKWTIREILGHVIDGEPCGTFLAEKLLHTSLRSTKTVTLHRHI